MTTRRFRLSIGTHVEDEWVCPTTTSVLQFPSVCVYVFLAASTAPHHAGCAKTDPACSRQQGVAHKLCALSVLARRS